ncbi:MAG: branched-chain amino acid ABC transporter permease [Alphaproteobacteria bacterium]|nr:branched-chain amino acid ABC transporter permease [Alphaproteobacteria bacterium]
MGTRRSGYFKADYAADLALLDTPFRRVLVGLLVLAVLAVPQVAGKYVVYVCNLTFIAIMGAIALNLLTGYAGQISLGHSAFLAVGGFVSYHFAKLGLGFVPVVVITTAIGALIGVVVGAPALRLRGLYLVLGTVGFHYVVFFLVNEYQTSGDDVLMKLTGLLLPVPDLGFVKLRNEFQWYYFLLGMLALVTCFAVNLVRTRVGRAWIAVRDRDITAAALGIDVGRYKLLAFVVSSALTSMTGALLAYVVGSVSAEYYTLTLSITYLAMVVVGGAGSILGSYLGAIFVSMLPYAITWLFESLGVSTRTQMVYLVPSQIVVFGLIMILFLIFEPRGLVGIWQRVRAYFELWPLRKSILSERK